MLNLASSSAVAYDPGMVGNIMKVIIPVRLLINVYNVFLTINATFCVRDFVYCHTVAANPSHDPTSCHDPNGSCHKALVINFFGIKN